MGGVSGRGCNWWEDRAQACLTATGMMQLIGGKDWLVLGTAVAKRIVIRDWSAVEEWLGMAL